MNDIYFKISCAQRKIDKAIATQRDMRYLLKVLLGVSLIYELTYPSIWNLLLALFYVILFLVDASNVKKIKAYEIQIYHLYVEMLDMKKEVADITGRNLPDYMEEKEIKYPDEEIKLPLMPYIICLVIHLAVGIIRLY